MDVWPLRISCRNWIPIIARVIETWQLPLRFPRIYRKASVPRQKPAAGVDPLQRASTRAVRGLVGNVALEAPRGVPTGVLPSGTVGRGPPPSRPQNSRATGVVHPQPGKVTDSKLQPVRAAVWMVPSKSTGTVLPKASGPSPCTSLPGMQNMESEEIIFDPLRFNVFPAGFQTFMGSFASSFGQFLPLEMGIFNQCLYHHYILKVNNLFLILYRLIGGRNLP